MNRSGRGCSSWEGGGINLFWGRGVCLVELLLLGGLRMEGEKGRFHQKRKRGISPDIWREDYRGGRNRRKSLLNSKGELSCDRMKKTKYREKERKGSTIPNIKGVYTTTRA